MLLRYRFSLQHREAAHFHAEVEGFGAAGAPNWAGAYSRTAWRRRNSRKSLVRISDVHLDVRLLWQWGKRDSPIVGRITDAAQIGRYVVWQCRSTNGP